jgi:hypothetical protein
MPVVDAFRTSTICPPPAIRGRSCHHAPQLWKLVKMPVPRYQSQIVFDRKRGDPQIVIRHRVTGAFELHE